MSVDPLVERSRRWSPYTYCKNNSLIRFDPDGMTDYTLNKETGKVAEVKYENEEEQKANLEAKTDRVVEFNKKGKVKATNINKIAKGILKNGMNLMTKDNVFDVGGNGRPTKENFERFVTKLSDYINKEVGGFFLSDKGSNAASHILLGGYERNTAGRCSYPDTPGDNGSIAVERPDLVGKVDFFVDFHTHLSNVYNIHNPSPCNSDQ
jgi:hypothetical protein